MAQEKSGTPLKFNRTETQSSKEKRHGSPNAPSSPEFVSSDPSPGNPGGDSLSQNCMGAMIR